MYLMDEMIMAMAVTSVLKLATTKYTVSNRAADFKKISSSVVARRQVYSGGEGWGVRGEG